MLRACRAGQTLSKLQHAMRAIAAAAPQAAAGGWRLQHSSSRQPPARSSPLLPPGPAARGIAASAGSSQVGDAAISPDTDVSTAIAAACTRLQRPFAADAVAALEGNWYSTAGELAALPDETARSLGVPLRLKAAVAEMLESTNGSSSGSSAVAGGLLGSAAAHAERLVSGWFSSSSSSNGAAAAAADGGSEPQPAGVQQATADAAQRQQDEEEELRLEAAVAAALDGGGAAAAAAAWDQAHLPIEERICAPVRRGRGDPITTTQRKRGEPYALTEAEMPAALREELAAFHRFMTVRFFGAQQEPIAPVTARKYEDHLRGLLGWLHRVRGVPLGELSLSAALPSAGREGVVLVFDYILWLTETRNISVQTEGLVTRAAGAAARFLYHAASRVQPGCGERAYSDLEVVKELRSMSNGAKKRSKVAQRASDEDLKWISWPEYLELCAELRRECGAIALDDNKRDDVKRRRRRPDAAVAWSVQKYLIFAILSCVPDRQRTLRELEVGRTLVKDREGRWVIRHGPGDYKTGRAYGERPPLVLSPHLYPELEEFMGRWRAALHPQHDFLFTAKSGAPLTDKSLYKLFHTTAYRLTGKKCNPHLVRDSVVTYLRGSGATERELEALAIYMGHSVEMQRGTYDRRTKEQKVEPAVELLASLNARATQAVKAESSGGGGSRSGVAGSSSSDSET